MKISNYHCPAFKAQVAQSMLREDTMVSHLADERGIHPNQRCKKRCTHRLHWRTLSSMHLRLRFLLSSRAKDTGFS